MSDACMRVIVTPDGRAALEQVLKKTEASAFVAATERTEPGDMPPHPDEVGVLLDAAQIRLGFETKADVWRYIGLTGSQGRKLLGKDHRHFKWPTYYTLAMAALG